jgi:hypothetical protein
MGTRDGPQQVQPTSHPHGDVRDQTAGYAQIGTTLYAGKRSRLRESHVPDPDARRRIVSGATIADVGKSSHGSEWERPVDQAQRLVPPGVWLDSPVFEQAEVFVYDPDAPRTADGWIAYAPIEASDEQSIEDSGQPLDAASDRGEVSRAPD